MPETSKIMRKKFIFGVSKPFPNAVSVFFIGFDCLLIRITSRSFVYKDVSAILEEWELSLNKLWKWNELKFGQLMCKLFGLFLINFIVFLNKFGMFQCTPHPDDENVVPMKSIWSLLTWKYISNENIMSLIISLD